MKMEDIRLGIVFEFDIAQRLILAVLVPVAIPALKILHSVALPNKVYRCANIYIAAMYFFMTMFNLASEAKMHMVLGVVAEVVLLCPIFYYVWKWPRSESGKIYNQFILNKSNLKY